MNPRTIPDAIRTAAIADYQASGESLLIVSRRHGISKTALASWVNPKSRQYRPTSVELAYVGTPGFEPRACGEVCVDCPHDHCGPCAEAALDREDERRYEMARDERWGS